MTTVRSLATVACLLAYASTAHAENDGVYGRLDGDLDIAPLAGAHVSEDGASAVVGARALFLGTVGAYTMLSEALGDGAAAPRTVAVGAAFRPFFIPRWALDLEHGPAILDLTLDAVTFDLGALWVSTAERNFASRPGFEVALGTEVPLLGTAAGPWIGVRGALRWHGAELGRDDVSSLGPALAFTLAWHFIAQTHLVDWRDRARP